MTALEKRYIKRLDLFGGSDITGTVYVHGDIDVYPLELLLRSNGRPFSIPANATVYFNFYNSYGALEHRAAEVLDAALGRIQYQIVEEDIQHPGVMIATVEVATDEQLLTFEQRICIEILGEPNAEAVPSHPSGSTNFPDAPVDGRLYGRKNANWAIITGSTGGGDGATFTPAVSDAGVISWTNDGGLPNPRTVNIKGERGAAGQDGLDGIDGAKGDKGDKGDQGIQGEQGVPGQDGAKGDKGDTGVQGVPGRDGRDGIDGDKGDTGAQGEQGLQGAPGQDGADGVKGDKGDTGAQGIRGERGLQGEQGAPGVDGSKGDKGDKGETGARGERGLQGEPGVPGQDGGVGAKGDKGDTGTQGAQGISGQDGADGKSALEAAQDAGYTGTEADFYAALARMPSTIVSSDIHTNLVVTMAMYEAKRLLGQLDPNTAYDIIEGSL